MINFPEKDIHGNLRTPYAISCPNDGLVYLSYEQYDQQMNQPDNRWQCPICRELSYWDDDNYEEFCENT